MKSGAAKRSRRRASRDGVVAQAERRPTLGPLVCRWIEANLVHGEGDYYGQPFRLRGWQKAFIYRCYELLPDGTRAYDSVLLGIPKGNGKTELAAAIACAELGGPVVFAGWKDDGTPRGKRRLSPEIPIAAASFEQADKLYGAAKIMIGKGRLAPFFEVYDTEILEKNGPGKMFRVAAVAGTNDGGKPTFFAADEVHEWTGNKERVHLVLSNGRAKRAGAWELNISTAGASIRSLLGRMVRRWRDVLAGKAKDPRQLVVWYEFNDPKFEVDLTDDATLKRAIREANPAADDFLNVDNVVERFRKIPEHEGRRYFLNQWADAPTRWIQAKDWERCKVDVGEPDDETEIVLALESNSTRESVVLVGATIEPTPHLFVVKAWQKGAGMVKAPVTEVLSAIADAFERFTVRLLSLNPNRWPQTIETLQDEHGEIIVEYESHKPTLMIPACTSFETAVVVEKHETPKLTHSGDDVFEAHLGNAIVKEDGRGRYIAKDNSDVTPAAVAAAAGGLSAPKYIEAAVAAVVALDLVARADEADNDGSWRPVE